MLTWRETTPGQVVSAASVALVACLAAPAAAQDAAPVPAPVELPFSIQGPPPPALPETIARDGRGLTTVRAVRLSAPLTLDGALDEPVYRDVMPASDFIQSEPHEGEPATQRTEVWILFDDEHVYVSARCWESDPERMVVNDMRRDGPGVAQNERLGFVFDTFYDRRNGLSFNVTPIGGRNDGEFVNERTYNGDWNPVYDFAVGRFDGGWTVEVALPFKSLRYRPGRRQIWGLNVTRFNKWKNEASYLAPVLASQNLMQVSEAATLVGLEVPENSLELELKPYLIADLTSDHRAQPPISNAPGADLGLDLKYGVTQNLVADLTINTDFAQVEADEQQVNLTRFSLFFPEKREFFLENQGTFAFGGAGTGTSAGGGNTPVLFYSRRIGLQAGTEVPIQAGGRLTGRVGSFSVGALNIRTGNQPSVDARATNFSVVRVKRDLLRRSSIGLIVTHRSRATEQTGSNTTYGVDGTLAFYDNLNVNTYWARTQTSGMSDEVSYRTQLAYGGDQIGFEVERLVVGTGFNPEVGFLLRDAFERSFGSFRFSPRPRSVAAIRKFSWAASLDYITDRANVLETREAQAEFGIELENSDDFRLRYTRSYEFLKDAFPIAPRVTIPVGGYRFQTVRASYAFGQQRRLSGRLSAEHGSFFGGDRTGVEFTGGRLELTPRLSVEPALGINRIDLPEGTFTTRLVTMRTTYTATPRMFVSALAQYNSSNDSLGLNLRLRWEYLPGSELFVVYNELRDTTTRRYPGLENRAFIIKINRMFRF